MEKDGYSNSCGCSMPNTSLDVKCSAQHCMYQKNGSCTAGMISVCGSGASRKDETECASFRLS